VLVAFGNETIDGSAGESIKETETKTAQEIHNWHDLDDVRNDLAGAYILMNDLDKDTAGYNELVDTKDGWNPIGEFDEGEEYGFNGSFDGNEYEIQDLYINRSQEACIGLFAVSEGEIKNVGIVGANITGERIVGGLVGLNNANATIQNSHFTGEIRGEEVVGGLVGMNLGDIEKEFFPTISNSYANVEIIGGNNVSGLIGVNAIGGVENSYAAGNVSGGDNLGGLVGNNIIGWIMNSTSVADVSGKERVGGLVGETELGGVENSYATGNVIGEGRIGGLVGNNTGIVNKSYAIGEVYGEEDVGGLIGYDENGSVLNSFWDIETTGQNESDGGTGKTTEEMKDVVTYTNTKISGLNEPWDFVGDPYEDDGDEDIWNIDAYQEVNDGYPFLDWQDVELGKFELTVNSTKGGEVVQPGEDAFEYEQWSEVDLEGVAEEGYRFVEWTGDNDTIEDPTLNKTTIKMEDNYSITANFEELDEYELTINIEGEGTTEPGEGTHTYYDGEEVTVKAIPEEDWYFDEWIGDQEGTEEEITIIMDNDKEITAVFSPYEPFFEVEITDYDEEVKPGTYVTIRYNVENTGELKDTQDIVFSVDGIEEKGKVDVTLEPGETRSGGFTWQAGGEGEYELEVASEDDEDTVTITVVEEVPGFTTMILILCAIKAVAIYRKKESRNRI